MDRLPARKLSLLLNLSSTPWNPSEQENQHFCLGIRASAAEELRRRAELYLSGWGPFRDLWIKDLRDLTGLIKVQVDKFYLFKCNLENPQQLFWCLVPFGFEKILCFTVGGCPNFC